MMSVDDAVIVYECPECEAEFEHEAWEHYVTCRECRARYRRETDGEEYWIEARVLRIRDVELEEDSEGTAIWLPWRSEDKREAWLERKGVGSARVRCRKHERDKDEWEEAQMSLDTVVEIEYE